MPVDGGWILGRVGAGSGLCGGRQESYKRGHDRGGMPQSLDGGIGPLLKIVMVSRHVEGGETGAAARHAAEGRGGEGHAQPSVRGQGALDGVGQRAGQRGSVAPNGG